MNRPEDIPERVWAEATNEALAYIRWLGPVSLDSDAEHVLAVSFARTILAAEKRVREDCARLGEEGYDRPVGTPYRSDGVRSKYDQCPHNRYQYEDCERCYAAAIRKGGEHA